MVKAAYSRFCGPKIRPDRTSLATLVARLAAAHGPLTAGETARVANRNETIFVEKTAKSVEKTHP